MRRGRSLFVMPVLAILLASCTSPFRVAGAPTFGRVDDISVADIQAAVSAYRASIVDHDQAIGPIEVISHDEIRIYQGNELRNYISMERVKGQWRLGSVVLRHPAY
jgi:hypothetical protein